MDGPPPWLRGTCELLRTGSDMEALQNLDDKIIHSAFNFIVYTLVYRGPVRVLQLLRNRGVPVPKQLSGYPLSCHVAKHASLEGLEWLEAHIDLSTVDSFGRSPIFYAVQCYNVDAVVFFLRRQPYETKEFANGALVYKAISGVPMAASPGGTAPGNVILRLLLDAGAPLGFYNVFGLALERGNLFAVAELMGRGLVTDRDLLLGNLRTNPSRICGYYLSSRSTSVFDAEKEFEVFRILERQWSPDIHWCMSEPIKGIVRALVVSLSLPIIYDVCREVVAWKVRD